MEAYVSEIKLESLGLDVEKKCKFDRVIIHFCELLSVTKIPVLNTKGHLGLWWQEKESQGMVPQIYLWEQMQNVLLSLWFS